MSAKHAAAVLALLLLAGACHESHGGHAARHEAQDPAPGVEREGLRLNDGKKWLMDDHTRLMFKTMVERVEVQKGGDVAAPGLGRALQLDLDQLIRGCTMTGDAHGELHKLLVDLIPAVDALAVNDGADEVQVVRNLLASYPLYFE